jgi:hypothetical protein
MNMHTFADRPAPREALAELLSALQATLLGSLADSFTRLLEIEGERQKVRRIFPRGYFGSAQVTVFFKSSAA